ncbi:MAG TPA: branched-chain amino acid ABC transporter permease [Chloroflexota bacterium]|nr:branched-chain amino acid ABC transporter permease [Chloroflexota bacterium]
MIGQTQTQPPPEAAPALHEGGLARALPAARRRVPAALAAIGLAVAILLPFLGANPYIIGVALTAYIYVVVTESWNLVLGISGILSFAQMGFFGVGAYTSAKLNLVYHLSPFLTSLLGGLMAVVAAVLVGLPSLRLRGVYVVLLTLAFQSILSGFVQTDTSGFTGGADGLLNVDPYLPYSLGMDVQLNGTYYLALAFMVVVSLLIFWVIRSPIGLGLKAIRDAEEVAANRGVNRTQYKMFAFMFSAFFTGVAGAFYGHYAGIVAPSVLDFGLTMYLMAMIVVGGWGTFAGPIVGTLFLTVINERLNDPNLIVPIVNAPLSQYHLIVQGLILVLTVVIAPRGLVGLAHSLGRLLDRRADQRPARTVS